MDRPYIENWEARKLAHLVCEVLATMLAYRDDYGDPMRLSKKNTGNPAHWTILLMKWALMCRDEGYHVYSKQARKAWDTDTMKAVLEEWAGETQRSDYGTEIKLNLHMKDHRYLDYILGQAKSTPRVLDSLGDADARRPRLAGSTGSLSLQRCKASPRPSSTTSLPGC